MYRKFSLSLLLFIAIGNSCKKKMVEPSPEKRGNIVAVESEKNKLLREVEGILSGNRINFSRIKTGNIDTTDNKIIIISFNNDTSESKIIRNGKVIFTTQDQPLEQRNSVLTVQYMNYEVKNLSDHSIISKTGTEVITNISGGLIHDLSQKKLNIIERKINIRNMRVQEDGKIYMLNESKRISYQNDQGQYKSIINGIEHVLGDTSVIAWGTNADGKSYRTLVKHPLTFAFCSGQWKIIEGVKTDIFEDENLKAVYTYGVDQEGNIESSCSSYGYSIQWITGENIEKSQVIPHP